MKKITGWKYFDEIKYIAREIKCIGGINVYLLLIQGRDFIIILNSIEVWTTLIIGPDKPGARMLA